MWKARNDILHKDKIKSIRARKHIDLQQRIEALYTWGRANLKPSEKWLFIYPLTKERKKELNQ